jgi:hypothetical protein
MVDGGEASFSLQAGISPARFSEQLREVASELRQGTLVADPPFTVRLCR